MRVLVVDDEAPARRRLVRMLERLPDLQVIGQARDGCEALAMIRRLSPDLVLLDIRMPTMDGITLASGYPDLPPIVFTTAHAEHALRAFDVAAIDYLLKPIEPERLARAIDRIRQRPTRLTPGALAGIVQQALESGAPRARIVARSKNTVRVLDPRDVTRLHSSDKYTMVRHGGEELVLDESLATLEDKLAGYDFVRVHRGELVNIAHVRAIVSDAGETWVELSDGQRASVSRRLAPELRQRLGV